MERGQSKRWIRNLIDEGVIPKGDVDTRSIVDVKPDDLKGYTQSHFFAGWPLALRQAGWWGDRPIWTGPCPCQSFSIAGKGGGKDDPRHLRPFWYSLIRGQSRRWSLIESCVNVLIGYGIAVLSQIAIFPLFDIHIPVRDNLLISLFFTAISVIRSYALRRAFNWWHVRT